MHKDTGDSKKYIFRKDKNCCQCASVNTLSPDRAMFLPQKIVSAMPVAKSG